MNDDRKAMLRRAAIALPTSAVAYGLGYGIARTALDHFMQQPGAQEALRGRTGAMKYAPLAAGALAGYAGYRHNKALYDAIKGEEKKS